MIVFIIQSIMVKIFVLSQIEILTIFLSIFVSSFWYRFDICVGATTARDEYGCSPGRLREGTSMAAFDLGAGRSPAIRLPQTRKNDGSFFRTVLLLCKKNVHAFVAFLCLHFCDVCASVWVLLPSRKYVRRV